MNNLPKLLQRKLTRKVAYGLWQYLGDKDMVIKNGEAYIGYLKSEIEKFLGESIEKSQLKDLLNIYHTMGYIPDNLRLELFLLKKLKHVIIASIIEDKKKAIIDD